MFFVAEKENFKSMFVEISVKMVLDGDGEYLVPQGQELAQGHANGLLPKVYIEATMGTALVYGVIRGFVYYIHGAKCNVYLDLIKISNLNLPVDLLVQGNEGFRAGYPFDLLYVFVEHLHQVFVVPAKHLDQNGPVSGGIMAFQYLGDLFQFLHRPRVRHGLVQEDPDIGHGGITKHPGVDDELGA